MKAQPPALPYALLARALGRDDVARAILGDLSEDFALTVRHRGARGARLWYWREAIALAVTSVAAAASYLPAWRATRIDPVEALKPE
jgi:hypothetical protein